MYKNLFKTALRDFKKHKAHTLINVFGLAISLACCLIIVIYVLDEFSYDSYHEKADQIYRVAAKGLIGNQEVNEAVTASQLAQTLVQEYPEVLQATRIQHTPNMLIRYEDKVFNQDHFLWVDSTFFEIFTVPMLLGDPSTALKHHHSVIMTEEIAHKYFDNLAEALGKIVTFEDGTPYKVTGIVENCPINSHFQYGVLSPLSSWEWNWRQFWLNHWMYTYIVLPEHYEPQQLEAKFPDFIRQYVAPHIQEALGMTMAEFEESGKTLEFYLQPIKDIHIRSHISKELGVNSDVRYIYTFSLIAFFILLIACINYMNLSTATSVSRSREIGIRKVCGSDRRQLIIQFFVESILLALMAMLLAIIIVEFFKPFLSDLAGKNIEIRYFEYWFILPLIILVPVVVGFLAGVYPSLYLSALQPVKVLKASGGTGSKGRSSFRNLLVVFQFSISIFLFISTMVIYKQLMYVQEKRLGFDKENVVVIKRGWAIGQNPDGTPQEGTGNTSVMGAFKNDLLQNPEVISVSGSSSLPGQGFQDGVFTAKEISGDKHYPMNYFRTDYDFARTLKLEFLEGRFFSKEIASDSNVVVINEATAQILGYKRPYVGKRIGVPGYPDFSLNIIGVVKDFHYQSFHHKVQPLVMGIQTRSRIFIAVRILPNRIPATVDYIAKTWDKYIPYKPFDFYFFDQEFDRLYEAEQKTGKLFTLFSVLAIFIACLGLFGLASFTTAQRTKEIGVRKVLGAGTANIVLQLSKDFTRWVFLANLIAWPAGWLFMNHWLNDFVYSVKLGLAGFVVAAFTALFIALLTVSTLTIKAALSDPVRSLRYE